MKMRYPAIPLATCTPDFSLWSVSDRLTDSELQHWSGENQTVHGILKISGKTYGFMGDTGCEKMEQVDCNVDFFTTTYRFSSEEVDLLLAFTTPLLLDDLKVLSRPITYVDMTCSRKTGIISPITLELSAGDNICVYDKEGYGSVAEALSEFEYRFARVGNAEQKPLTYDGDMKAVNSGYFYLAAQGRSDASFSSVSEIAEHSGRHVITVGMEMGESCEQAHFVMAYDSIYSIEYFKEKLPCRWRKEADTMEKMISIAFLEREEIIARCKKIALELRREAVRAGGEKYCDLLKLAYRQTIGAHIISEDKNGEILFISKECGSGAHAATVDVTYPSMPLFLKYCPELVKGMIRPIFRYSKMEEWSNLYKFAPHDAGFYPIVNGQTYPEGRGLDAETQMPIEECANMLVICAAICKAENNADFLREEIDLLQQWCAYLLDYGYDPGEQLCTDDFAGRLAHNCNLSIKAIMGIASYGIISDYLGEKENAVLYKRCAREYAAKWLEAARNKDGTYRLAFDRPKSFSLKYNAVWDRLFGTEIFPDGCFDEELKSYITVRMDKYGTPIDNRKDYAKADWILWCATMMNSAAAFEKMITPLWAFYNESEARVPMTDLYHTRDASVEHFRNRTVQGGLFIKLLHF